MTIIIPIRATHMKSLQDTKVVDLTQSIAGPICTQMLSSVGSEVIKIEPPHGDAFRPLLNGSMFSAYNNGKKSICVDLKSSSGEEVVEELAANADIIIESFRPGVLDKYGLDYDTISATNPEVIYCSLSGYGQTGPSRNDPGYDPCIQATSGLMATTGYPDRPPVRIRSSLIDCATGTNAAFAIMAALRQRDRTGKGEYIDVSLFDVGVSLMSYWIANYDSTGEIPKRDGRVGMGSAPNGIFEADDGYVYMMCMTDEMFTRLCSAIDRLDLIDEEQCASLNSRVSHRKELRDLLNSEFSAYSAEELERILLQAGVPAAAVRSIDEVVELSHTDARSILADSYNTELDEQVKVASVPFRFGSIDGRPSFDTSPPKKGEDTTSVLQDLSYSSEQIEKLRSEGAVR